jgi:hypothetical protein
VARSAGVCQLPSESLAIVDFILSQNVASLLRKLITDSFPDAFSSLTSGGGMVLTGNHFADSVPSILSLASASARIPVVDVFQANRSAT